MKAYQLSRNGRKYPLFILDTGGLFLTTLEEFKRSYGLHRLDSREAKDYLNILTDSRMSLSKDRTRLDLKCNPMTDDLALIFSEWLTKKPGFRAVPDIAKGIPIEEFEFPF
ncbi:MAG: hypothetical protein Q8922_01710 [Bacteroidota bacterium]|nr:hypothetical protein [Bacteroidota bacterium]MDP4232056.1 hypothetical protein [Bacteroidota bacterium]MDP4241237.1 hypothetical protein [Bacteroidota bacterium]MDP4286629.1 hypothetical protein [Bacteroidota bacterium]